MQNRVQNAITKHTSKLKVTQCKTKQPKLSAIIILDFKIPRGISSLRCKINITAITLRYIKWSWKPLFHNGGSDNIKLLIKTVSIKVIIISDKYGSTPSEGYSSAYWGHFRRYQLGTGKQWITARQPIVKQLDCMKVYFDSFIELPSRGSSGVWDRI